MKKLFIVVGIMLIIAMAGLALVACSGGNDGGGGENTYSPSNTGSENSAPSEIDSSDGSTNNSGNNSSNDTTNNPKENLLSFEYTVVFDANGGALSCDRTQTVTKGNPIIKPSDPVYPEHIFVGWSKSITENVFWDFSSDNVSSNITLYAIWEEEIIVSFNANGGEFSSERKILNTTVEKGKKVSEPERPMRDNYIFTNWYVDNRLTATWDFSNDSVVTSITLYAGWIYDEKNVTFVLNYSGAKDLVKKTVDGKINYTPERDGYVFNGWWLSSGKTSYGYILSKKFDIAKQITQSNLVLYAEWVDEATMASQLQAPSVSMEDGVFSWDSIPNSQGYGIIVLKNSTELDRTTINGTSWSFPYSYDAGYYTVKIRAQADGINAVNSVYVSKSYAHKILPAVTDISMDISTSMLTWSALDYSAWYDVYVNNIIGNSTNSTFFDMSNYDAGSYSIRIEAGYSDYTKSSSSKTITKFRLKSPTVSFSINNNLSQLLEWDPILYANQYIVRIDDNEFIVKKCNYEIPINSNLYGDENTINISVFAFDTNADYLISTSDREYTRTKPFQLELSKNIEEAGSVNQMCVASMGEEVTLKAENNLGYQWIGWFEGEKKVSESEEYTFIMPAKQQAFAAKWEVEDAMKNFIFSSSKTTCVLNKVKDSQKAIDVVIPDYVTELSKGAFDDCTMLVRLTIGSNVKKIGDECFKKCFHLTEVYNKSKLGIVKDSNLFHYTYFGGTMYYSVKDVYTTDTTKLLLDEDGYYVYSDGGNNILIAYIGSDTSLILPQNITDINNNFARNDTKITSVMFGEHVTHIGLSAFYGCTGLSEIVIPDTVTGIEDHAFYGCTGLISATLGRNVQKCYYDTFGNCSRLVEVFNRSSLNLQCGSENYGRIAQNAKNVYTKDGGSKLLKDDQGFIFYITETDRILYGYSGSAMDLVLPQETTELAPYAFSNCKTVKTVVIPNGITSISPCAFMGCENLIDITIPETVTSIGKNAFANCYSLTSFVLPETVTSIGYGLFANCINIISIRIPGRPSMGTGLFAGCRSLVEIEIPYYYSSQPFWGLDLFSSSYFEGSIRVEQSYYWNGAGRTEKDYGYVPQSLSLVTIHSGSLTTTCGFSGFSMIKKITLGENVGNIDTWGATPFAGCTGIVEICNKSSLNIQAGSSDYGYIAYYAKNVYSDESDAKVSIDDKGFILYTDDAEVSLIGYIGSDLEPIIPSSVTSIQKNAFLYNDITSINFIGDLASWCSISGLGNLPREKVKFNGLLLNEAFSGNIVIPDGVLVISENAFEGCSNITSVTFPDSVINIGESAFWRCTSLRSIILGERITSIGESAFSQCKSLISITLPTTVTSIENYAFSGCDKLVEILNKSSLKIQKGATDNGSVAYYAKNIYYWSSDSMLSEDEDGYVTFMDGSKKTLIAYTGSETRIALPEDIEEIYQYAFGGRADLVEIKIPNSVKNIGEDAFSGCTASIIWGDAPAITSIRTNAFRNYLGTTLTIPDSITSIQSGALSGCSAIEYLEIPFVGRHPNVADTNTYQYPLGWLFGTSSYEGGKMVTQYYYGSSTSQTTYTDYCIPLSLANIKVAGGNLLYGAFYNCSMIKTMTIGKNVKNVKSGAFTGCTGLELIVGSSSAVETIAKSRSIPSIIVTSGSGIAASAFAGNSYLTSITIPNSVTSIGASAFSSCSGLTSITFLGTKIQWNAVSKGENWNKNTGNYIIHCNDGDI